MEFKFNTDINTYNSALKVFKDTGLDIDSGVNVFLKKVIKDRNIDFIFNQSSTTQNETATRLEHNNTVLREKNLAKSMAKVLFANKGIRIIPNSNIGALNKSMPVYWVNPKREALNEKWHLILNDTPKKKLYLFEIPTYSNLKYTLVDRTDREGIIDLRIMYRDNEYTDIQSGAKFLEYKIAEIDYV